MTDSETLIKWLMENGVMRTRFDKTLNEQMVEVTDFGIEINTILNKMKTSSPEAEETNQFAADKIEDDNNAS